MGMGGPLGVPSSSLTLSSHADSAHGVGAAWCSWLHEPQWTKDINFKDRLKDDNLKDNLKDNNLKDNLKDDNVKGINLKDDFKDDNLKDNSLKDNLKDNFIDDSLKDDNLKDNLKDNTYCLNAFIPLPINPLPTSFSSFLFKATV